MDGVGEEPLCQFDCDDLLDHLPELQVDDIFRVETPSFVAEDGPSPNPIFLEIENLLLADDDNDVVPTAPSTEFDYDKLLAEILVDPRADSDDGSSPSNKDSEKERVDAANPEEVGADPVSKKLTRQMRNRDAAVRSRERKKLYVKNLEMKSRYYEGECRRLEHLLQCCFTENHALRLCLQARGALGASMTKQESAVLLLESLLLGSLLWFMGVMCQLNLPLILWSAAVLRRENKVQKDLIRGPRKGPESNISQYLWERSFAKSRRCRASRRKMKFDFLVFYIFWSGGLLGFLLCLSSFLLLCL